MPCAPPVQNYSNACVIVCCRYVFFGVPKVCCRMRVMLQFAVKPACGVLAESSRSPAESVHPPAESGLRLGQRKMYSFTHARHPRGDSAEYTVLNI